MELGKSDENTVFENLWKGERSNGLQETRSAIQLWREDLVTQTQTLPGKDVTKTRDARDVRVTLN